MGSLLKRFSAALILAMFFAFMFMQVPRAYSAESTVTERTLTFLADVIRLDMTKYDAKLVPAPHPSIDSVKYTLKYAGSELDIICRFRNNNVVYCHLYELQGSTLYAQTPPASMLDAAKGLIQRYQTYSGASYLQSMRSMIDKVVELKPMETTSGNVKFRISNNSSDQQFTYFDWVYTENGIDVEYKKVRFTFLNGAFQHFSDGWDLYKVGSTSVNVSREEAIRIAREQAQNYILNVWPGEKANLSIADEPVRAELSLQGRVNYTLYPHWNIQLYFDKGYGSWNGIQVFIWADTGEVIRVGATGGLGGSPDEETPPSSPEDTSSANNTNSSMNTYLIAGVAAAAIAVAAVALKKRRR